MPAAGSNALSASNSVLLIKKMLSELGCLKQTSPEAHGLTRYLATWKTGKAWNCQGKFKHLKNHGIIGERVKTELCWEK